mgnify:CR=1 FL=1
MIKQTKPSPLKMAYDSVYSNRIIGSGTSIAAAAAGISGNPSAPIKIWGQSFIKPVRGGNGCVRDDDDDNEGLSKAAADGDGDGGCVEFVNTCKPVYVLEKHLTVIRRGPTAPPRIEMFNWEDDADINVVSGNPDGIISIKTQFYGDAAPQVANDGTDISNFFNADKSIKKTGDDIELPIDMLSGGMGSTELDWDNGYTLLITHKFYNHFNVQQTASCRVVIDSYTSTISCKVLAITDNFPLLGVEATDMYEVGAELIPPLFELKFPKFAYRYKYEDGEYSVFSPWSEIAFMPGKFDYLPKKGFNVGMQNNMRSIKVKDWRPKNMPADVVEIDLLYKESNSPNIYTVETFKKNDTPTEINPCLGNGSGAQVNHWNICGTGDNFGSFKITSELIHKVVPSNQLLRPWDNVPRMALAQDITANRIIYANYLQSYNLLDKDGELIKPSFGTWVESEDLSITGNEPMFPPNPGQPMKSLKSMRTYQVGVVYRDRHGRETPVLTSQSGALEVPIKNAKTSNRLAVQINTPAPDWAESYTFYIKETSNEYYNLAMDRWYDAEDDGIWLSFPSSERNKVTDRTTLILKKQHDTDRYVESDSRYKVLSVKGDAPTFIKTYNKFWGSLPMMLPPPGWGTSDTAGGWNSGMFYSTGLPLPGRLYIDIYAEYWDQSILAGLEGEMKGSQIRITQSQDQGSAYNATPSQTSNVSKWYDVSRVSRVGSEYQTQIVTTTDPAGNTIEVEEEVPSQATHVVRITLETLMGDDLSFCMPNDNLALSRGLALEARVSVERDNAEFEGRFFVKVLRDLDVQDNIVQTGKTSSDFYQVLMARDVRYISAAHPGAQDARTGAVGTTGVGGGDWYGFEGATRNFLPVHKDWSTYTPDKKYQVSSLSAACGDTHYIGPGGGTIDPNMDSSGAPANWPFGPTYLANRNFTQGWWYNKYDEYVDSGIATKYHNHSSALVTTRFDGTSGSVLYNAAWFLAYPLSKDQAVVPNIAKRAHNWPSYLISDWEPRTCGPHSNNVNLSCEQINPAHGGTAFLHDAGWAFAGGINMSDTKFGVGIVNKGMKDLNGANPFHLPAIWGDQSDLLGYSGNPDSGPTNLNLSPQLLVAGAVADVPGAGVGANYQGVWSENTILKLRQDWYFLWHGRDKISTKWPLGRFAPKRWFFDKVGAAKGYSGNGIWTENNVSRISLSYYGIGTGSAIERSHNMLTNQQEEFEFGRLMATSGTQFRFRDDPYSTVYTVTEATAPETVLNYEPSYGSWGIRDTNGLTVSGGGNLGGHMEPPWGSPYLANNSIAGKAAFLSDLFSSSNTKTGGAVYNYRIRVTITLDKEIGGVGQIPIGTASMGFHPLLNHVNIDGDCNIQEGPQVYWDGAAGATPVGWLSPINQLANSQDVLPTPNAFYNLSSYWNTSTAPTAGQDGTFGVGDVNGQHFGLHERGLNSTSIEIVTAYKGDEIRPEMSNNPAVWETEPMEDVGLDIYYAASPTYPINVLKLRSDENRPDDTDFDANYNPTNAHTFDYNWRGEEMIPVGATVTASCTSNCQPFVVYNGWSDVAGVQGNMIWTNTPLLYADVGHPTIAAGDPIELIAGDEVKFFWKGEGEWYGAFNDNMIYNQTVVSSNDPMVFEVDPNTHDKMRTLPYYNCYTFSNGVESNRIRDDYNAVTIDKGVKASMPLAEQYKEERKPSSLIFSGIYNSTSGINRTNQFIQAEPITKDLNPINGSIQKIYARDTDLVTFCENKVFKILANKDALFNADGNKNITSNKAVLGATMPFSGEYGISRNPESFAAESYRLYFADKDRGAVLRLSKDGLTPISDKGMSDWFKDNLREATSVIGSYDSRKNEYNITVETTGVTNNKLKAYTLSYTEANKGWVSFKSFVHQGGVSHKNIYYTFPSNKYSNLTEEDPWGKPYSDVNFAGGAETFQHALDLRVERIASTSTSTSILISPDPNTVILVGMNVEGNGVSHGTVVAVVNSDTSVTVNKAVYLDDGEVITFTTPRNRFYDQNHYSMVKTIFNKDQGNVKRFKTINYEGSQGKIIPKGGSQLPGNRYEIEGVQLGQIYLDNYDKEGWYVHEITTDMQEGSVKEFVDKENKWFDYIRGKEGNLDGDHLDTGDFSLQGLGMFNS